MSLTNSIKKLSLKIANQATSHLAPTFALKLARYSLLTPQKKTGTWPKYVTKMKVRTSRGKVAVYKYGQGKCVWLVHDWSSSAHSSLPLIKELASQGFSVVTFDLPAHGNSDGDSATMARLITSFEQVSKELFQPDSIIATGLGASVVVNSNWFTKFTGKALLVNPELDPYKKLQQVAAEKGVSQAILTQLLRGIVKREGFDVRTLNTKECITAFNGTVQLVNNKTTKKQCPTKVLRAMAYES